MPPIGRWQRYFPPHILKPETFSDELDRLIMRRDGEKVLKFWSTLGVEGTMHNILFALPREKHEATKRKIYEIASFLTLSEYKQFKKALDSGSHIMEFTLAINAEPPNMDLINHFIAMGSPRYYSPDTVKWFWETLDPMVDDVMRGKLLVNCTNAVCRWVSTKKRRRRSRH